MSSHMYVDCGRRACGAVRRLALALFLMVLLIPAARGEAQSPGVVNGVVLDTSGGAISGAGVSVQDAAGRIVARTTTAASGMFEVRDLPSGRYVVQVEQSQFELSRTDVEVAGGTAAAELRIVLEVSGVRE
ncbi:MAG: carboxypeptidase-like regulatory domain-containing protein, partial [Vicinamibacterales bacterium]